MRRALSSPLRMLMIWCLALLLPLQGLAAGAGLHCMAMAAVAMTEAAAHPCHGMAEMAEGADGAEGKAAAHAQPATTASPDLPTAADPDDHPASSHTCSACAACCVAAALPSQSRWAAAVMRAGALDVLPRPHRAGVVAAGLERPPRTPIV